MKTTVIGMMFCTLMMLGFSAASQAQDFACYRNSNPDRVFMTGKYYDRSRVSQITVFDPKFYIEMKKYSKTHPITAQNINEGFYKYKRSIPYSGDSEASKNSFLGKLLNWDQVVDSYLGPKTIAYFLTDNLEFWGMAGRVGNTYFDVPFDFLKTAESRADFTCGDLRARLICRRSEE